MRIALDCRTVTSPKTGDRTYALNLLRALAAVENRGEIPEERDYLLYTWEPTTLTELGDQRFQPVVLPALPLWTWTPWTFPLDLKRRGAHLAHVQYLIPPLAPCPVVTTIHDVAFRRFPGLFPLKHRLLLNALIPMAVHNSALVLTGSEATRKDLIELFGAPEDKVVVTPYAADPVYRPMDPDEARRAVRGRLRVPTPYLLAVGVLQPRKNLPRLIRAYSRIAAGFPHRLVLVGKAGWDGEELQKAVSQCPQGREPIFTGYVADADLPALYAGADLFAYPSLYEGFGLPPLEAMACGTAVLTSNTSSLPEVVGDAALQVDPRSETDIAAALRRLLEDDALRSRLGGAGLERAKEFSWERTARETIAAYESVHRQEIGTWSDPGRMKPLLGILTGVLAVAVVVDLVRHFIGPPPPKRESFTAADLDGRPFALADYRGKQPVVVTFFSLSCGPCRMEYPHLVEMDRRYRDRGLKVVLVGEDAAANIRADETYGKSPFTVIPEGTKLEALYKIEGLPHLVYFEPDGQVGEDIEGFGDHSLDPVIQRLERLPKREALNR